MKHMLLTKLKIVTVLAVLLAVAGVGAWGVGFAATDAPGQAKPAAPAGAKVAEVRAGAGDKAGGVNKAAAIEDEPITAIWITEKRVQKELRLTEAQIKQLYEVRAGIYKKHEAAQKAAREAAKKGNFQPYRELSRKIQDEEKKALTTAAPQILSASALKRLRQIQRQARGLHNLIVEPAVRKKLDLNDEQVKQMEKFLKEGQEAALKESRKRAVGPILAPLTIEGYVALEQKAFVGAMKGVLKVLTPGQRRAWNDLIGEPFAFKVAPSK